MSAADAPLAALRRDLDIVPYEHEGRPVFLLADAERAGEGTLALSPGGMAVAALFDGRRTAEQVRELFSKETGSLVTAGEIRAVAAQLEQAGLLETPATAQRRRKTLEDFLAAPTRKAAFQGAGGYPAAPLELAAFLGGFFRDAKGPAKPLPDAAAAPAAIGLISPHIDLHRGGPAYAWAYRALAETQPPDVIVALGVAHVSPNSPWILTKKPYETPYGPMNVHQELYEELKGALWYDPLADEWAHRREHSLEFQALWLRYVWREKTPPWIPILCSSFERWAQDKPPSSVPTVEEALEKIGALLARRAKTQRVLILAGVDLAHVGRRFGDELDLTPDLKKKIETEDRASLDRALALDADGFYRSVAADGHWRKVCGLSALYTALRWIGAVSGSKARAELLAYDQAPDPMDGLVSFASAIYRRPPIG